MKAEIGDGEIDPLSPEHVVPWCSFLASPAARDVNGQVFVVYGPQVTLLAAPTLEHQFVADAQAWEPHELSSTCRITCWPRPETEFRGDLVVE